MKNALVILDHAILYDRPFVSYLSREIAAHVGEIETVHFVSKRDDDVVKVLEEVIAQHRHLFVVTAEAFSFAGKLIATICHDGLVLKEKDMLVPFKAEKVTGNSYLIHHGSTAINVLKVDPVQKLPQILIDAPGEELGLFLFDDALQADLERDARELELGFEKVRMTEGLWHYRIRGLASALKHFLRRVDERYRENVLVGKDFAEVVCRRLMEEGATVTAAESCTGGLLASEIVRHSGVSSIFEGSEVTYSNEMKQKLIGVKSSTLRRYGAVSQECVQEMLGGVIEKFGADFAMAISGVAGPGGGTRQKPVGTVYVGAKCRGKEMIVKRLSLKGDRTYIREMSVLWAFRLLVETNRALFFKKIPKTLDK
ncbi:MAG TPA: CinA family protein [Campylobacteraceae bacterium]|nr:CinA family protein [Campylobacteraceae bacterium]HHD83360.1 CinA family protein [Campylobacteraceae bacterium]